MYPLKTKYPYNPDNLASTWNIYSTVYLWNYITWNFDEWAGSHLWVDIIPQTKHDDVVACLDWTIDFAWTNDFNGNFVIIKHINAPDPDNLWSVTTLFSCHLHLSELNVKTWDSVKEGNIIWKSWNSGNSTWEHLHFQIDTWNAPFHPYWPFKLSEANALWLGFFEAVNKWLWIDNAKKYSINPLVYLDKVSALKWTLPVIKVNPVLAFSSQSKYFKDVSDNVEEIDYLAQKWITKGNSWYFMPNANITRWELLIMALKFAWINPDWDGKSFSDVLPWDWCESFVRTATSRWFIAGYSDGTFRPNNAINRAEAVAIALNVIIGKSNIPTAADTLYQDVKTEEWFSRYTNYVSENWLLDSIGKFYPADNMKRSDFAVLLYNLKDKIK
ncbi:MAG: S-layer protein [uncultured bacterium (gcode 4)]|uniref:S-layer protein n=1 Tax=uncultured bacterium (gcode 4) TaxID=1234023 RepID=K2GXN2_9BACT|nr:MAG: S-layer protein [uncultured bacterium (gcode 4)]